MTASPSALPRICAWKLSQSRNGVPLKLTISSPGRMPASAAGLAGSAAVQSRRRSAIGITQAGTAATVGSTTSSRGLPYVANRSTNSEKAMAMLTIGPPAITITFFHHTRR